ncbi:MAG TPA: LysR family transcriptional regulator [Methylomirabilota bacterium]|nr:LysR family transcriptional regulator [Methylomirabilota bacterium]
MRVVNEFLATGPFDLYELKLFHLVAEHRNFTRAGQAAGLTQSAITRQIQGMEARLGLKLFDRSTRHVRLTPEGAALHARSGAILAEVDDALRALRGKSLLLPRTLRVGVSRTIGLAYLPGFFRAFQRKLPEVQLHVSHQPGDFILAAVESGELQAGIVCPPPRLPSALEAARQFNDEFVLILPPRSTVPPQPIPVAKLTEALRGQRWLFITRQSNTGKRLHAWLEDAGFRREPAIEADNFDFIVNLVSLGLGASLVPHRVLALHPRTRPVVRIRTRPRFSRQLAVIVRREATRPGMVSTFVDNVLF